jgi:hypothetical protein
MRSHTHTHIHTHPHIKIERKLYSQPKEALSAYLGIYNPSCPCKLHIKENFNIQSQCKTRRGSKMRRECLPKWS